MLRTDGGFGHENIQIVDWIICMFLEIFDVQNDGVRTFGWMDGCHGYVWMDGIGSRMR